LNQGEVVVVNLGLDSPQMYSYLAEQLRLAIGITRCIHDEEEANLMVIAGQKYIFDQTNVISNTVLFDNMKLLLFKLESIAQKVKACAKL